MQARKGEKRLSATELLHTRVYNHHRELLGEVDDVILDADEGVIIYIYLSVEENQQAVTIPWSAFELAADRSLLLDVSVTRLKEALH